MATTPCPKCGKPLRPGAKFCGSCGHVISGAQPPAAAPRPAPAQAAPAAQQGGGPPCPHCGQPLRPGAKFCNNCGKSSTPSGPVAAPITPPAASAPSPSPALSRTPAQRMPGPAPVKAAPPGRTPPPAARPGAPVAAAKRPPRKGLRVGIIAAALTLCLVLVVVGYFILGYFDVVPLPFGPKTEVAVVTTETQDASTPPGDTKETLASTDTPLPTFTPVTVAATTEVPTLAGETNTPLPPTDTLPGPSVTPGPAKEFVEDFSGEVSDLNKRWSLWGNSKPLKRKSIPYLELKAVSNPNLGGLTSFVEVPYKSGAEVEFKARLSDIYDVPMFFYWDPSGHDRTTDGSGGGSGSGTGGGDSGIGVATPEKTPEPPPATPPPALANIHFLSSVTLLSFFPGAELRQPQPVVVGIQLDILKGKVLLYFPNRKVCDVPSFGQEDHTYRIRALPGTASGTVAIELSIDGGVQCTEQFLDELGVPIDLTGGQISFTGSGMLYLVKILTPLQ